MAAGILRLALDLACAAGLLLAAACAAAFEIGGTPDRRRHPTSRRFAWLRLAVIAVTGFAVWAATILPARSGASHRPPRRAHRRHPAPAAAGARGAGRGVVRWFGSMRTGLGVAVALIEGRVLRYAPWAGDFAAWPGLSGAGAGLALGLLLALALKRQAAERPPMEDEAL